MKKILAIIMAAMIMATMALPASAANIVPVGKTISYKMPSIKTVNVSYDTVYKNAKTAIQSNVINNLYKLPNAG